MYQVVNIKIPDHIKCWQGYECQEFSGLLEMVWQAVGRGWFQTHLPGPKACAHNHLSFSLNRDDSRVINHECVNMSFHCFGFKKHFCIFRNQVNSGSEHPLT